MRVGITGHQRLADDAAWSWVREALIQEIQPSQKTVGISSLAIGADQLFAECVLGFGGALVAVIPFPDYSRTFASENDLLQYQRLLGEAEQVITLSGETDDESSYLAAGEMVVQESEMLVAVWDGLPAKGKGGTGDIVNFAVGLNKRVLHIEPLSKHIKEIIKS